jgi:hypothetical protein
VTDAATELSGAAFGAFFYNTVSESNETLALYTLSGAPRSAFERFPMSRGTDVFGPMLAGEGIVRSDDILADLRYGRTRRTAACQPSSSAPAFEVIAPPSKPANTRRPSTGAKSNNAGLHSVGIGDLSCIAVRLCRRRIFSDSEPRCTYAS